MDTLIFDVLTQYAGLSIDVSALDPAADLYRSGLTSHACINVMLALEDTFDVEFEPAMLRKSTFESIDAIRDALMRLGAGVPIG